MKLELYYMESCPFCAKVLSTLDQQGMVSQVTAYDISEDERSAERLMELNKGDEQVPCLVVDGRPMLGSDEIITWLSENVRKSA